MRRFRSVITLCGAVILLTLLTGCWDQREIEERTSVVAIGIDSVEGDPMLIEVSVQVPIPLKIAGSGGGAGGGGDPVKIFSATGRTPIEAFTNLQKQANQKLFYGHTRIIAIGEDLARVGVNSVMDTFRRDPQIRRLLWPLIVKGKASDLLRIKPEVEQIPTVYIMSMIENGVKTGQIPDMNLGKFYISLSSKSRQPYLNYVEARKDDIKWSGVAVFRRDKMVGTLNESEAWMMMRIREEKVGGPIVFSYQEDPEKLVSFDMNTIQTDERFSYEDGRVHAAFKVFVEGDLIGKTFATDFSDLNEIKDLEGYAELFLEKETKKMVYRLQKEYTADILGIGNKLKAYHPDIWSRIRWPEDFAEAVITVIYDVKLRRTGMEMQ